MTSSPTSAFVESEGYKINYWHQGSGPLLLFVPGASGCGSQFNNIMAILSETYTCGTFDRRGKSTIGTSECGTEILSPPQQARDIAAVIKAIGFEQAIVFTSSLGGILGFQLAMDYPDVIDHLICHETPIFPILPDSTDWFEQSLSLQKTHREQGFEAALGTFMSYFQGFDNPDIPQAPPSPIQNLVHFLDHEIFVATLYNPDWRKILQNRVSVGILKGRRSGDAYYARSTVEQADILGCQSMEVPGHHGGFEVEAADFAPVLQEMIEKLVNARQ